MNSVTRVKAYLEDFDLKDTVHELSVSTATVPLAAAALGVEEGRIAKTLSFKLPDDRCVVVVAAGDAKVDNKRYKTYFGHKATMPKGDEVFELTGHAIGGVCPFALKEGVEVYLDISLRRFETVFPACGSDNSMIEMSLEELRTTSKAIDVVDVCKAWQESDNES